MKFKKEIFLWAILLGLIFCMGVITNKHYTGNYQKDDENSVEPRDEVNLKTADKEIIIITPEKKTYTEPMSGYYLATYGFEDEKYGTLWAETGYIIKFADAFWRSDDTTFLWARIVPEWQGHNNCLSLIDSEGTQEWLYIRHENFNETRGAIEWYWGLNANGSTHDSYFRLMNDETQAFEIKMDGGYFAYNGSSPGTLTNFNNNTWYHHRLLFDCSGAGNGRFNWTISLENGTEIDSIENIEFTNKVESIDKIHLETTKTHTGGHRAFFDAFGFSWEGYNLGDNLKEGLLLQFENSTNLDWMGYSLDEQAIKTILGNFTIPMPEDGSHTIQVFGNNSLGTIYSSDIRQFYVNYYPFQPSDGGGDGKDKKAEEPTIPVIASVAIGIGSAIGISAIAMILFRKRILPKRKIENN